jgi:hypothetical protein
MIFNVFLTMEMLYNGYKECMGCNCLTGSKG